MNQNERVFDSTFSGIVDELEDVVYVSDPETYDLLYLNEYTRRLCQLPDHASLKGQKCYQILYGQNSPCEFCPLSRLSHQSFYAWDGFNSRLKRFYSHRDKLIVAEGKDAHLSYWIDMTEQKKIENELLISEQCFNIAMDNSDRSLFDVDLTSHSQYNRRLNYPLTTLPKLVKNVPETIIDSGLIHPDSISDFRDLYQRIFNGQSNSEADIQLISEDGTEGWAHFIITTVFRKDGTPLRAIGVCEDISNQKNLSLKYQKSKEYQAFLLRDSVVFLDIGLTSNNIVRYEHNSEFLYEGNSDNVKLSYSEMIRDIAKNYVFASDSDEFLAHFSRTALLSTFEEGENSVKLDHRIKIGDSYCWVSTSAQFVRATHSDMACILLMKNIDEQKRHELDLLNKMEHDEQTGFYVLSAASSRINEYISADRSSSTGTPNSALLLVRIDGLTGLFSKYGKDISNNYISNFCSKLTSLLRSDDIVARCGDNLFLIYVRNLPSLNAMLDVAKNILESMKTFFYNENKIVINVGCACFPYDGNSFEEVYEHTEDALSDAISQGHGHYACYKTSFNILNEGNPNSTISDEEILAYEKAHPPMQPGSIGKYENDIFELGNHAFKEVNSLSSSSLTITVVASVALFITLIFGLYTDTFFDRGIVLARIIYLVLHAVILLLLWFRVIYFYQQSIYNDPVTRLRSRRYFEKNAPNLYKREGMRFAIVYTNISKFKLINDKYGRQTGDEILRKIHRIYSDSLLRGELAARIMADDFALLLHFSSYDDLSSRLEQIDAKIKSLGDFDIDSSYNIDTRYGVYVIVNTDLPITSMLDCANMALTSVSRTSNIPIGFYDDKITRHLQYEQAIESKMRSALNQKDFLIYFLPKYRTEDMSLVGAEALIRWKDSEEGMLLPEDFLPIFEKNGFVAQTDLYVFENVVKMLRKWLDNGYKPFPISVNLSPVNLKIPNFLDVYEEILKKYQIPENLIEFEMTEAVIYDNYETYRNLLDRVHAMNCLCTLDDFGSSYSSLSLLKTLPVDVLKLDRSLLSQQQLPERVADMFGSGDDASASVSGSVQMIKSITDLAHSLGCITLFEGVENEEMLTAIRSAGCEQLQGSFCSGPLPEDEFEKLAFGKRI